MFFRLFFACLLLCVSSALAGKMAYTAGDNVWVANADGTGAKKLVKGSTPSISPDGTRVAFDKDESPKSDIRRFIAIVEVATAKVTVFRKGIPSDNCQRAVWSPDGQSLLFSFFTGDDWHLGMVDATGGGFRTVAKPARKGDSLWSPCWAPDGHSFFAQDLDFIRHLSLDGKELRSWDVKRLFPDSGLSSATRLALSPDGRRLLIDVEMNEAVKVPDFDGPAPAVWLVDLESGKTTRLSKKGTLAWAGGWASSDEVLLTMQGAADKQPALYRLPLAGGDRKLVLKNVFEPTFSQ